MSPCLLATLLALAEPLQVSASGPAAAIDLEAMREGIDARVGAAATDWSVEVLALEGRTARLRLRPPAPAATVLRSITFDSDDPSGRARELASAVALLIETHRPPAPIHEPAPPPSRPAQDPPRVFISVGGVLGLGLRHPADVSGGVRLEAGGILLHEHVLPRAYLGWQSTRRSALQVDTSFAIETPPGASTLDVSVATRILVVGGDSHVSVDVRDETFTVHRGRAAWAPDDVEASGGPAEDPTVRPAVEAVAADDLAALAETQLAAGQRTAAIRTFERLVLRHPRSAVTKSGLIDLARLYKLVGSPAKARCAYALHLERWPASPLRAEVQRAMESLGEGPECAGLRPQRP